MRKMKKDCTPLYVYVFKKQKKELERIADEKGMTLSCLLRITLEQFLSTEVK